MKQIYPFILEKASDVGLLRSTNEDSVLTLVHPEDDRIKLLVVCDGMGGMNYGDVAANYVTSHFGRFFLAQHKEEFSDIYLLKEVLSNLVMECNQYLIDTYGKNQVGTTLTLALITLEETILVHLGDSRCYFYKNQELKQMTEDDSDVWLYYKYHQVEKEDLRYFSSSNIINNCVGLSLGSCRPHVYIYPNESYESLLLVSDGVTDLITDSKLQSMFRSRPSSLLVDAIVHEAVYVEQHLFVPLKLREGCYDRYVVPIRGRDNASAVLFSKI